MTSEPTESTHTLIYDERYRGNYMDTDKYSQWTKDSPTHKKVLDTLMMVPFTPHKILDYGCGVGGWIPLLTSIYPNSEVSGVDISREAIRKASERYPKCEFASFKSHKCPYPDATFDMIFSFHVLEHVTSIEDSITEISRLLKDNGFACIIFPCGNKGSLQELLMRNMQGGILPSDDGRIVHFFEIKDGHLRRMTSSETVKLFESNDMKLETEYYSNQIFGWIDWLCRGTGPGYINRMFSLEPKQNLLSKIFIRSMYKVLYALNLIIRKKDLDLTRKRNPIKQSLVFVAKQLAIATDALIKGLSTLEWRFFRKLRNGTAQYLVFKKV